MLKMPRKVTKTLEPTTPQLLMCQTSTSTGAVRTAYLLCSRMALLQQRCRNTTVSHASNINRCGEDNESALPKDAIVTIRTCKYHYLLSQHINLYREDCALASRKTCDFCWIPSWGSFFGGESVRWHVNQCNEGSLTDLLKDAIVATKL